MRTKYIEASPEPTDDAAVATEYQFFAHQRYPQLLLLGVVDELEPGCFVWTVAEVRRRGRQVDGHVVGYGVTARRDWAWSSVQQRSVTG